MTTVISTLFISLDGVAEIDPAWHFPYFDEHMGAAVAADYEGTDVLMLGRTTYDSFAGAWPARESAGEVDAGFAKQLGDLRKVVGTHRPDGLGWRNVEASDDLLAAVAALRTEPGVEKVLVAGSLSVVHQLLRAGELDEVSLLVHPVVAGKGARLFEEVDLQPLKLVKSAVFPTGVVHLHYAMAELPGQEGYDDIVEHVPGNDAT